MKVKTKKQVYDVLQKILDFSSEKEKRVFSEMVISSDAMTRITQLMKEKNITIKEMAKKLKMPIYRFVDLCTGDEYITIPLLAKCQEILDTRFEIVPTNSIVGYYKNKKQ